MATKELSLVVTLQDKASQQLQGLQGSLQRMQPAFRKMAIYGTAAFAGISVGIGKTIKDAGRAEKIADNFETTFGESSDTINSFIGDFGDKFAFVESEMRQGANAIGFQLNAMGEIGKEEGEKIATSLLTASGGLSDFFGEQMNVTQAAQALSKGLSGNRAQLQEMGFNVYAEDIKEMAKAMGLNTEELTKAQEAQAFTQLIMEQTSGSVGALERNMDSYTGRLRAARKATKEMSENLGKAFLPAVTALLEVITPIISKMSDWAQAHPRLVKYVGGLALSITGLVAIIGGLGLLMPGLVNGFIAATTGIYGMTTAAWAFAATPIGAIITVIAGAVYLVTRRFLQLAEEVGGVKRAIEASMLNVQSIVLRTARSILEQLVKIDSFIPFMGDNAENALDSVNRAIKRNERSFREFVAETAELNREQEKTKEGAGDMEESFTQAFEKMEAGASNFSAEMDGVLDKIERSQKAYRENVEREDDRFHDNLAQKVAQYEMEIGETKKKALREEKAGNDEAAMDLFEKVNVMQRELNEFYSWDMDLSEEVALEKKKAEMGELELMKYNHLEKRKEMAETQLEELKILQEKKEAIAKQHAAERELIEETVDISGEAEKSKVQQVRDAVTEKIKEIERYARFVNRLSPGRLSSVGSGESKLSPHFSGGAVIRNVARSAKEVATELSGIPFADGGIVTRPTLGLVGEAGPEAIIPLDQMGKGGTTVNVTVNGDVSGRELVDTVKRAIFKEVNRQVKI